MINKILNSNLDDSYIPFDPPKWVNVVAILSVVITIMLAILIYFGVLLAILTSLTAAIAMLAWLRKGYTTPLSRRILPVYILAIIINLVQGAEQHAGHYFTLLGTSFPNIVQVNSVSSDMQFAAVFSFATAAIYLFGATAIFYQTKIGSFLVWWIFSWSVIFPASHFLLPLISESGPALLPGIITAPFSIFIAATGIWHIQNQDKTQMVPA